MFTLSYKMLQHDTNSVLLVCTELQCSAVLNRNESTGIMYIQVGLYCWYFLGGENTLYHRNSEYIYFSVGDIGSWTTIQIHQYSQVLLCPPSYLVANLDCLLIFFCIYTYLSFNLAKYLFSFWIINTSITIS